MLAASLAYGAVVVLSAGTLMLAISSLSRNSRFVGASGSRLWLVSGVAATVLNQTIHKDWCPLLSYTANLTRIRDTLLDSQTSWDKLAELSLAGQNQLRQAARPSPFRRRPVASTSPLVRPRLLRRPASAGTQTRIHGAEGHAQLSLAMVRGRSCRAGRALGLDPGHPRPLPGPLEMKSNCAVCQPLSAICHLSFIIVIVMLHS